MDFTKALIKGNHAALQAAKSLLTTPMLYKLGDPLLAIPIEVEQYQQDGTAEVSESLIITASKNKDDGSKKYIADNVSPSSWTWTLTGYISGISQLEPTNLFPWVVRLQTERLKRHFRNGARLVFKGIDCTITKNVVIQSLSLPWQPDCANKQPVSITLKEINVLDVATAELDSVESKATPATGGVDGAVQEAGTTATTESTLVKGTDAAGFTKGLKHVNF